MDQKFYGCNKCDTIIAFIKNSGTPVTCCGEVMKEIIPGTTDASQEKHVPVVTVAGNKVTVVVGSVEHPMAEEQSYRVDFPPDKRRKSAERAQSRPATEGLLYDLRGR